MAEATDLSGTAAATEAFLDTGSDSGSEIHGAEPAPQEGTPAEAEPQAPPAETPNPATPQVPEGHETIDIDGEQVTLSREDRIFLIRHGARAFLQAQAELRKQMEGGEYEEPAPAQTPPAPPPQQAQDPQAQVKEYTKALEKRMAELEGTIQREKTQAQARQYVEDARAALKKVDFFKDLTPEEEADYTGMVLMLQNASRGTLKPIQAAQRLGDRLGRRVNTAAEKWKLGKIEAAGKKVEGSGATHPTPPKKVSRQGFWNGEVLSHALGYLKGTAAE